MFFLGTIQINLRYRKLILNDYFFTILSCGRVSKLVRNYLVTTLIYNLSPSDYQ